MKKVMIAALALTMFGGAAFAQETAPKATKQEAKHEAHAKKENKKEAKEPVHATQAEVKTQKEAKQPVHATQAEVKAPKADPNTKRAIAK